MRAYLACKRFIFNTLGCLNSLNSTPRYRIRAGYLHRRKIEAHDDSPLQDQWQKEVYEFARECALRHGIGRVIDIGCGSGYKLVNNFQAPEFETLGTELPRTLARLKDKYPDRTWLRQVTDLEARAGLVICSDVIEHVKNPHEFLEHLRSLKAELYVISTPDRSLIEDAFKYGPPLNPCHFREWSFEEFQEFLAEHFKVLEHFVSNKTQATQVALCRIREG